MSDNQDFGFGKFVPGFDFLQNLAKGASQTLPQLSTLSNWVAPTLNVEELDKRIGELKAVHFWLDQNSKALGATIQALEVQKMTLATLKGMNVSMGELANSLQLTPTDTKPGAAPAADGKGQAQQSPSGGGGGGQPASGVIDPLQWWGALTQQFQQIAAGAMKDPGAQAAAVPGKKAAGATAPRKTGAKRAAKKSAP
ncbi:MAG: hypothetical protein JWP43_1711 [Ramlibacter sp.]|nr:hypothetical protein [Ramlibacter sp.]